MTEHGKRFSGFLPIFIIIMSVLIFFGKVVYSGRPLFGSDFVLYFYPLKKLIRDYVFSNGTIPLWNPFQLSGTPLITNIQASMFYPLDFLFYILPTKYAYGYTIIIHCMLGSIFMYVFVRSLSVNKMGAVLSSIIFTYNGFFMAHIYAGHLTFVQNYIWIPLIFFYLHKFLKTLHPRHAILAGLFLGVQILGGFPQIAFYTIFGAFLYAFYSICTRLRRERGHYAPKAALGAVAILLIGFSLAAVQLLPTYEFAQLSTRAGGISYEFATLDSLPPKNFVTFLIPDFFGVPANRTFWISDASWTFWEYCGYVGLCALILPVITIKRIVADRVGIFFVFMLVIALFLSLGKYNPLYRFIYYLPGFHHFRIPAQILFLYVFSIAVLAGMGLHHLTDGRAFSTTHRMVVLCGLLIFLILTFWVHVHPYSFFFLLFKYAKPTGLTIGQAGQVYAIVTHAILRSSAIFLVIIILLHLYRRGFSSYATTGGLLILISMADIGSFAFPLVRTVNLDPSPNQVDLIRQLKLDGDIYRAVVNNGCFPANAGLWYRFQDIQGYDPLILRRYMQYVNKSQHIPPDNKVVNMHYIRNMDNPLINMLNLKYTIDCNSKKITKRNAFVPRAYIVHRAVVKDDREILDYMMTGDFDPLKTVVFTRQPSLPKTTTQETRGDPKETCRILSYACDEIIVDARLNTHGFLVMSEINYPGWQALVDGRPYGIRTGNYLFRTVPLEAGKHTVRFVFNPRSFKIGSVVSLASLLAVIIGLLVFSRKRKPQRQDFPQ
jgi:hypothetical protein